MITYQYHCPTNDRTLEVQHSMRESIRTWGELCQRTGNDPGKTPADTPVERLISGGLHASVSGGTSPSSSSSLLPMAGCCGNPSSCHHHG